VDLIQSWPKYAQHFYADERHTRGITALGALRCSPRRAELLRDGLTKVRRDYHLSREMKWSKVSRRYLDAYEAWVDVLLDDPFARFLWTRFEHSSPHWHLWRRESRGQEIFRAYYAFLLHVVPVSTPSWIRVDELPTRSWRWERIPYLINKKRRDDWGIRGRNIHELRPVDSKGDDLLQLADVLLGALDTRDVRVKSPSRHSLSVHVAERINENPELVRRIKWVQMR
jgi:hypothetical protein